MIHLVSLYQCIWFENKMKEWVGFAPIPYICSVGRRTETHSFLQTEYSHEMWNQLIPPNQWNLMVLPQLLLENKYIFACLTAPTPCTHLSTPTQTISQRSLLLCRLSIRRAKGGDRWLGPSMPLSLQPFTLLKLWRCLIADLAQGDEWCHWTLC